MDRVKRWCVVSVLVLGLFLPGFLSADEKEEEALRSVLAQYQDSILTVRYVLKMTSSFGKQMGMPEEQKGESVGTVIDPSGILVMSNSQLRGPAAFLDMMEVPGMEGKFDMDVVPLEFKVVMPDGSEIPAKLIAQDSDLDIAFLKVELKEKEELKTIPLVTGLNPQVGEILVTVGRLSESLNREPMAYHTQVISLVNKPRKMVIIAGLGNLGCPVFNSDGKTIGITLMRKSAVKRDPMMFMSMSHNPSLEFMPMVLPCEEIIEALKKLSPSIPQEENKAE